MSNEVRSLRLMMFPLGACDCVSARSTPEVLSEYGAGSAARMVDWRSSTNPVGVRNYSELRGVAFKCRLCLWIGRV